MKKKIISIVMAIFTLSLVGCGSNVLPKEKSEDITEKMQTSESAEMEEETQTSESVEMEEETTEAEMADVSGVYQNISLFFDSTYQLNENGTYDKLSPEEKGTYIVDEGGKIAFTPKGVAANEIFAPLGMYYYRSNDHFFDEDEEYGTAPVFDENGRTSQTFETPIRKQDNGEMIGNVLTMNEDGTFILENEVGRMQGGMLVTSDGDKYEGEYTLNDEILTLKWNGAEYQLVFINDKLYYDVIRKQSKENEQEIEAGKLALQAAEDEKYAPVEESLANEICDKLKGEWNFAGEPYTVTFDGFNVSVAGMGYANQGTYIVCKDILLITYENGNKATMNYLYENGEMKLAALVALNE